MKVATLMVALLAGYLSLSTENIAKPIDGCTEYPSPTVPRCRPDAPQKGA